jgi:hypothetical protein
VSQAAGGTGRAGQLCGIAAAVIRLLLAVIRRPAVRTVGAKCPVCLTAELARPRLRPECQPADRPSVAAAEFASTSPVHLRCQAAVHCFLSGFYQIGVYRPAVRKSARVVVRATWLQALRRVRSAGEVPAMTSNGIQRTTFNERKGYDMKYLLVVLLAAIPGLLVAAEPALVFEDRFDGKLAEGWSWLRENPKTWRIADGALEICVEPGVAATVKNALVRPAPDRTKGTYAFEVTVTFLAPPSQQYEQAGITWYNRGKPVFKLVHELIDGKTYIIPGRKETSTSKVQLRLIVSGDSWTAQFRPDAQGQFQTAATGKLPPPGEDQVSIQCYNGPPNAEHWIRFDDFRILKLPE